MKKYILLFFACIWTVFSFSQAIGQWKTYPALQISTYNIPIDNKVYSLCNGNLFSYDTNTTEVHVYDRINGLHDIQIKFIRYCKETHKLLLIYENGNIDIIYPDDDEVVNLKQIKDKNYTNFTINNVCIVGKTAYICTDFGIIELDSEKEEFTATYNLDLKAICCTEQDGYIYLSTSNGFYKGNKRENILDKNNWKRISSNVFEQITLFGDELVGYWSTRGICTIEKNHGYTSLIEEGRFNMFSYDEKYLILSNEDKIVIHQSLDNQQRTTINIKNKFQHIQYYKNTYWTSQGIDGLQPYQLVEGKLTPTLSPIQPNSPIRDYFCNMHYDGNRLLIAGGDLNYNGINRDATVMYYENDTWCNFIENDIAAQTGLSHYINTNSIAQDPKDPMHHFVSTPRLGLYEYRNLKFIKKYDYTNSPLQCMLPTSQYPMNYVGCSALNYDKDGNLWMINNEVEKILLILKADNTWVSLYYPEIAKTPTCNYFVTFDRNGNVWFNSQRMSTRGIFFLDYNGTLEDTSDDIHMLRQNIVNQDGITYNPDNFYCVVEDHNGEIWIGTDIGPFVISQPERFTDADFTYTQVKIARNDGTEYADYLLNGVSVTCIAVDAANRKWIGTAFDGVYLVSEDGQEMIHHFTCDNSPLISDVIQSIVVSPQTGEVMIGTEKGLVSYMSDATTPEQELDKDNVSVYPNPVSPDYDGIIAVNGLTADSEVKITTVTGQLVYTGHSKGGLFTWDGRNKTGRRVSSGIYNVIATNAEGKKAIVTRITFIH